MSTKTILALVLGLSLQHTMVMFHAPRWSPDGKWIVLSTNIDGDEDIWVVSADGAVKRQLTDTSASDTAADWTDDGRSIVFRRQSGGVEETLIMSADGSNVSPYTEGAPRETKGIAVVERRSADGQAIVMRRKGGPERRISEVAWAEQPSVSPDGRYVVFEQRGNPHDILNSDVVLWDITAATLTVIARGTDPSWSPDGKTLLFKAPRGAGRQLTIVTADVATGVTRDLAPGVHPQFSPDGRSIVFMADRSERADVYVMGADGSGLRCVTCTWRR